MRQIQIRNVRVNNLQNINLDIPHGQWLAVCGLSGSGKSSLAFDTLYAEGQRRYIESLSPQTRQFLQQLDKPDADRIDGIPPAVAVKSYRHNAGPRTTVGTTTEITDYLRLLFSRGATVQCPTCNIPVHTEDPQSVAKDIVKLEPGLRLQVGFEVYVETVDSMEREILVGDALRLAKSSGFIKAVIDGKTVSLGNHDDEIRNSSTAPVVLVDRLKTDSPESRIRESLETAFQFGNGQALILFEGHDQGHSQMIDGVPWSRRVVTKDLVCGKCSRRFPKPEPRLFSFNSPLGACPTCEGFGSVHRFDMDLIVPDDSKTLSDGAIAPWTTPAYEHELNELADLADDYGIQMDVPFSELPETAIQLIWAGVPEREFGGLNGFFAWLEKRKYKMPIRVFLSRWRKYEDCPDCRGGRLNGDAICFFVEGKSFPEISQMKISDVLEFLNRFQGAEAESREFGLMTQQLISRIGYLDQVGLGYLSLDRTLRTLSSGEAQRVSLTSSLSSTLVNMLYVLDEPSRGLHKNDVKKLIGAIGQLSRRGNTVVVVDHEDDIISAAERIVEIGPGAGDAGGRIVFDGGLNELLESENCITGQYLSGRRGVPPDGYGQRKGRGRIKIVGARGNNLKNLTVEFPLATMCVVTGVSGSGKSSLVQKTMYGAICKRKKKSPVPTLPYENIFGDDQIEDIVLVDQTPIGTSARSNPVTYVKAFDEIRKTFAETMDAKTRNLKASHFSFNVEGGRCDKCKGDGQLSIDMQFLTDIHVKCDQCRGQRYRDDVLQVKYRNKNIHQALNLTVRQAFSFFRGQPKVQSKLKSLIDVGLDYVRLGQSATTLSSGESQRLKLASYLNFTKKRRSLFVLDEPTTGLHINDVVRLLDCLEALLAIGHSLVIVEHNLHLIKHADWIIDMGPGAAENGGQVIAEGTPRQIAQHPESITGRYLKPMLDLENSEKVMG